MIQKTCATGIQTANLQSDFAQVSILSLGCITQDWQVNTAGEDRHMVLGYRNPEDYLTNPSYLGVIAGRMANRIGQGRFELDGQTYTLSRNAAPHTLHGGAIGLGRRNWQMERDADRAVRLKYQSPDGEDGFPGAVAFEVTISLDGQTLSYEMRARPDRPTPVNLAQHSYYTLGQPGIADLFLTLPSDAYTQNDATGLPTGGIRSVDQTDWDFRGGRQIKHVDPQGKGIDHNFVLDPPSSTIHLTAPDGVRLIMKTDQPGLQLYTATHLETHAPTLQGQQHQPFSALCLEPQNFPDAVNQPLFPNPIYSPDRPYAQSLSVSIGPAA